MSLKVEYSAFALSCLNDIYEYILVKSKSNQQASYQIELLLNSIDILKEQPEYGKREELLEHLNNSNIRFIIKGEYKIIYEYTENKLKIIDVFHTKQNPDKIKSRDKKNL